MDSQFKITLCPLTFSIGGGMWLPRLVSRTSVDSRFFFFQRPYFSIYADFHLLHRTSSLLILFNFFPDLSCHVTFPPPTFVVFTLFFTVARGLGLVTLNLDHFLSPALVFLFRPNG